MNNKKEQSGLIDISAFSQETAFNERWKQLTSHDATKQLVKSVSIKKEAGDSKLQSSDVQGAGGFEQIIYPIYNRESLMTMYTMNEIHSACIDLLSNCVAGKGYKFLTNKDVEGMDSVLEFAKKPNKLRFGYTLGNLLQDLAKDMAMYNTIQTEIYRDALGHPNMYRANPRYMFIQPARNSNNNPVAGKVENYWQVINGKYNSYAPYSGKSNVRSSIYETHIQSPLSDYYGEPAYVSALKYIIENDGISTFNRNFFANGARLSYALVGTGHTLTDPEKASITAQIASVVGIENTGKILTIMLGSPSAKIALQQMSQAFDMSFLEQKKLNDESIMLAHIVSARLLGKSGSGSIGGGSEDYSATKKYLETVVEVVQSQIETYINMFIEEEFGVDAQFKLNSIDVMSEKDRAIITEKLFGLVDECGNRAMDVEDAREYNCIPETKMKTEPIVDINETETSERTNSETTVDDTNNADQRIRNE